MADREHWPQVERSWRGGEYQGWLQSLFFARSARCTCSSLTWNRPRSRCRSRFHACWHRVSGQSDKRLAGLAGMNKLFLLHILSQNLCVWICSTCAHDFHARVLGLMCFWVLEVNDFHSRAFLMGKMDAGWGGVLFLCCLEVWLGLMFADRRCCQIGLNQTTS